jgi:hypothetical protein
MQYNTENTHACTKLSYTHNFKLLAEADENWAFGHQDNYCLTPLHKKSVSFPKKWKLQLYSFSQN